MSKCAFGHKTYHSDCDACDSHAYDPDTGWGGFKDHFSGKHFNSEKDRDKYYEDHNSIAGPPDEEEDTDG